jgi:hypothetical protein
MSSEVREYVLEQLRPLLPEGWRLESGIPTLERLAAPTVWLEYTAFEPMPEKPLTHIAATVAVCIAINLTDLRKGEDAADDHVADLYAALYFGRKFYSMRAEKTVFADTYIGWRITTTVAARKRTVTSDTSDTSDSEGE